MKLLEVDVGNVTSNYSFSTIGISRADMQYIQETIGFTATGNATTLSFASRDQAGSAFGPLIGGVSAMESTALDVPEPQSVFLFGMGIAALSILRKRTR